MCYRHEQNGNVKKYIEWPRSRGGAEKQIWIVLEYWKFIQTGHIVASYYQPKHKLLIWHQQQLEWFSIEYRKTKSKEITLANHKGHTQYSEPIKTLTSCYRFGYSNIEQKIIFSILAVFLTANELRRFEHNKKFKNGSKLSQWCNNCLVTKSSCLVTKSSSLTVVRLAPPWCCGPVCSTRKLNHSLDM